MPVPVATRIVFERLASAGAPGAQERETIYNDCRAEIAAAAPDDKARATSLAELEKAIRRQEMQALYEESLIDRK